MTASDDCCCPTLKNRHIRTLFLSSVLLTDVLGSVDVGWERIGDDSVQVLKVLPDLNHSSLALGLVLVDNELGGESDVDARVQMVVSSSVDELAVAISNDVSVSPSIPEKENRASAGEMATSFRDVHCHHQQQ